MISFLSLNCLPYFSKLPGGCIPQLDAGSLIGIGSHLEIHDYIRPKRSYLETIHDSKWDFGDQSYSIVHGPGIMQYVIIVSQTNIHKRGTLIHVHYMAPKIHCCLVWDRSMNTTLDTTIVPISPSHRHDYFRLR